MATATPATPGPRWQPLAGLAVPAVLLGLAAAGWWWAARMARMDMAMAEAFSLGSFLVAWVAMLVAMMLPAIVPVVRLYARAAARGHLAPLPFFVAGYLIVWSVLGLPGFVAWRHLAMPLAEGAAWAGRAAGSVLLAAAIYQVSPLKSICLRHCRSPLSFFMQYGRRLERPFGAAAMGVYHGGFCLGCCWALMAVLVALGTVQLWWMVGLAALIFVEKNVRWGEQAARLAAVAFAALGVALLLHPAVISRLV